eukprot:TRINITY_DN3136_c0_g2_i3.p2 TRINITY_DN3136_c0_g2~~TRINITY_DN3136_c0_g2_i3.p2  ORF type:complete len:121 (-),score=49.58 TRINITY_DN3136_c0_g2_i3:17-379(-)
MNTLKEMFESEYQRFRAKELEFRNHQEMIEKELGEKEQIGGKPVESKLVELENVMREMTSRVKELDEENHSLCERNKSIEEELAKRCEVIQELERRLNARKKKKKKKKKKVLCVDTTASD